MKFINTKQAEEKWDISERRIRQLLTEGRIDGAFKKEKRLEYYEALDKAHTAFDYTDFIKLVTELEIEMVTYSHHLTS